MRTCISCGKPAQVYLPYRGVALCANCFFEDVKHRVLEEIKRHRLFEPNHKLLLALSGGKDSFVLLDVMAQIHDPSKLVGLSIIEGIRGYNKPEDMERMRRYARERGVDVIITSFKDYIGYTLDELVELAVKSNVEVSPCTFCGILRRRIMNHWARMLGADRVLTAHNLDDEVQTMLLNILRGDAMRLLRTHPLAPSFSGEFVRRVKPLRLVHEWECALYAALKGFEFQETECRYIHEQPTLRARVREHLYGIEYRYPGTMLRILESVDKLVEERLSRGLRLPELPLCEKCGEPTSYTRRLCKLCELLEMITGSGA